MPARSRARSASAGTRAMVLPAITATNSSASDEVSPPAAYGVPVIEARARGPVLRLAGLLVLLAAVVLPGVASAHESLPTGVQRIELSLGERELALTVTAPP